jgi:hypothetical protein
MERDDRHHGNGALGHKSQLHCRAWGSASRWARLAPIIASHPRPLTVDLSHLGFLRFSVESQAMFVGRRHGFFNLNRVDGDAFTGCWGRYEG